MDFLTTYALVALVAAVFVFVVSSVMHIFVPIHKSDYAPMPDEEAVLDALRANDVPPGTYMFPYCHSMKELGEEATIEKFKRGPVGWMTLLKPGPPTMGKSLLGWFVFSFMISLVTAYLADLAIPGPAQRELVFRFTATTGFLAYGLSAFPEAIWKGQRLGVTLKFVFDGLLYGLATGYAFELLWPA